MPLSFNDERGKVPLICFLTGKQIKIPKPGKCVFRLLTSTLKVVVLPVLCLFVGVNANGQTNKPVFGAYNDVTITADANCLATIPDYTINARVTTSCSNANVIVTQEPMAGTPILVNKPTSVRLTAKEACGGTATVFFSVTSLSKPVINPVPTPIAFKLDANGNYTIKLSDLGSVYSCDNGKITTTITPQNLTCVNIGQTTVTLTASTSIPNPQAVTFSVPTDIVTDAAGNLYIADGYSCKIRKIALDGTVTAFAGGDCGYADGKGGAAKFNVLNGLTIDPQGNMYAVDENDRVRKISPTGEVTTLAGNGQNKSVDGKGLNASFRDPRGIAIDLQGNLYVTQGTDYLVRKVTPAGDVTTITKPAAISKLFTPIGVVTDALGNVYVTDYSNAVKKIAPDGTITIVAGHDGFGADDGKGTAASFNNPKGIVFDKQGNLYVTDSKNNSVRKIDPLGNVTTLQLYNAGTTEKTTLNNPVGIKMDLFGNLLVVDSYNERIVRITPDGQLSVIAGNGVAGYHDGNANTPPTIGNQTSQNFVVTVSSSENSTIPAASVLPSVAVMPQTATVCKGDPVDFTAAIQPDNAVVKYQWLINGISVGQNSTTFSTTKLNDGDMVTCITSNTSSCILPKSSDPIMVHINPLPEITFNGDPVIKPGNSIQLLPLIKGGILSYAWSPSAGLSDSTIANPFASPWYTFTYKLKVVSTAGCSITEAVTVKVLIPIDIPNTFTPNGDGINDRWEISALQYYPNCTVDVYNRNGQVLFHSNGYKKPWDGTSNGSFLQSGTYYYIVAARNGVIKPIGGWVMIMR